MGDLATAQPVTTPAIMHLPGHGFDAVFPAGYQCPQDTEKLATAPSPAAGLTLDHIEELGLPMVHVQR